MIGKRYQRVSLDRSHSRQTRQTYWYEPWLVIDGVVPLYALSSVEERFCRRWSTTNPDAWSCPKRRCNNNYLVAAIKPGVLPRLRVKSERLQTRIGKKLRSKSKRLLRLIRSMVRTAKRKNPSCSCCKFFDTNSIKRMCSIFKGKRGEDTAAGPLLTNIR
jgi:hypothetical protein